MKDKLDVAIAEAERFLERAKAAKVEWDKYMIAMDGWRNGGHFPSNPGVVMASMKRSSLDLSRALADLRGRGRGRG